MQSSPPRAAAAPLLVAAALAAVYLVWGTTYLAIHVAVQDLPPFLLGALRFAAAGAVLYTVLRLRGAPAPSRRAWAAAAVVGGLMFLGAHGALAWASQRAPSGIAAMFAALTPVWIGLGGYAGFVPGHRPAAGAAVGLVAAFAGLALLLQPWSGGAALEAPIALALLFASLAWAAGSVASRAKALPDSPVLGGAMANLAGGALLFAASGATGETAGLDLATVPTEAWGALLYLIVPGSIVAFSAYTWLLRVDGPGRASMHTVVNPLVALVVGALLAGEAYPANAGAAAALIVLGVGLTILGPRWAAARLGRTARPATEGAPAAGPARDATPRPRRWPSLRAPAPGLGPQRP